VVTIKNVSYRKACRRLKRSLRKYDRTGNEEHYQNAIRYQEIIISHKLGEFGKMFLANIK
jgi:hypothetical protein